MTRFRPCIDLHAGQVKQIVGATLTDVDATLTTNFVSPLPASHFARLYRINNVHGAHLIMLGPGNEAAAREALAEWPGKLQIGGGITEQNAQRWLDLGAEKIIITSYLFPDAAFSLNRLQTVTRSLKEGKERLVIDLSCRRVGSTWVVAMNKWQTLTDMEVDQCRADAIHMLEPYCSEFLVHAADNEGLQQGIDEDLVCKLGEWCSLPVTYAGGSRNVDDLRRVQELSNGRVDLTIGSALDIFGGSGVRFEDCVQWNNSKG